ncbi:MAG: DUF4440 domain-containing protein [Gammaproteobacteria bacterium]
MFKLVLKTITPVIVTLIFCFTANAAERRQLLEFTEFGNPADSIRSEVLALLEEFKSSWAEQDTDRHMELFAVDAEWINAYARMFRGTEELAVFLEQRLFPNFDSAVSRQEMANARLLSIRYLGDDAAVVHMATDGSRGPSAIPGEALRRTHLHLVLERQGQRWHIVHTAIMDARE